MTVYYDTAPSDPAQLLDAFRFVCDQARQQQERGGIHLMSPTLLKAFCGAGWMTEKGELTEAGIEAWKGRP
jgi:hypothetical protein